MKSSISISSQTGISTASWSAICSCTFTGKEKDVETGYGYFGARYMDHELMTGWLSVDPMADKYPSISPYAYCAWNPMKLVDPDGRECETNNDWYKDAQGHVHWNGSVHSQADLSDGETYIGQTAAMVLDGTDMSIYGDQYGQTHSSIPLKSVEISYTRTEHERIMANPLVNNIHQSAGAFWEYPVTQFTIDATLFVITGGVESVFLSVTRGFSRYQAKHFFDGAKYSPKVNGAMMSKTDSRHAFPTSVDAYAAKFGEYSSRTGADGATYKWLTLDGSYKNTTGQFEYIKNNKGIINHRFLNVK